MVDYEMARRLGIISPYESGPPPRILREPPEDYDPDNEYRKVDGYDIDPNPAYRKYRSIDAKEEPDRLAKLLCPPRVWGYSLPTKRWGM